MPRKKQTEEQKPKVNNPNVLGLHAEVVEQPITETLEVNYMPYAMSVIVSRAIPEIDGFKPSHRKLLYTMYKMNLLGGARTKSANIVGQTMRLNPHGDAAIYDTMVRLSTGYGALLHPFVDGKGNFGKAYSRDMAYAASRYTEAKLSPICLPVQATLPSSSVMGRKPPVVPVTDSAFFAGGENAGSVSSINVTMSRRSKRSRAPSRKKAVLVSGSVHTSVAVSSLSGDPPTEITMPPTVMVELSPS